MTEPLPPSPPLPSDCEFWTEDELATFLGLAPITVRFWRRDAKGPNWIRLGRLVRYRRADVEAWLKTQTVGK